MSQSRMLGVLAIKRFENLRSPFLVSMQLVAERSHRDECERVEDLRLGITRVVASDLCHSMRIPLRPSRVPLTIVAAIVRCQSLDKLPLPKRASSTFDSFTYLLGSSVEILA